MCLKKMECPNCKEYFTRRDNYHRHIRANCPMKSKRYKKRPQLPNSESEAEEQDNKARTQHNFKKVKLDELTSKSKSKAEDSDSSISESETNKKESVRKFLKQDEDSTLEEEEDEEDDSSYYSCDEDEDNDMVDKWYNLLQKLKLVDPLKSFSDFESSILLIVIGLPASLKQLACSRLYQIVRKQSRLLKSQGMLLDEIYVTLKESLKPALKQFFIKIQEIHEENSGLDERSEEEEHESKNDELSSDEETETVASLTFNKDLENQKILEISMWRSLLSKLKPLDPFEDLEQFMETILLVSLILPRHLIHFKNERIYKVIEAQADQLKGLDSVQIIETLKMLLKPFLIHHYNRIKQDL